MKRLLYTLLVVAVSSGSPVPTPTEGVELDVQVESFEVAEPASRGKATASVGNVAVSAAESPEAANNSGVAGTIFVDRRGPNTAQIDGCVSIGDDRHDAIAARLLEAALNDCTRDGTLKVQITVPIRLAAISEVCRRCRYNYSRSITRNGRQIHEFYADLYTMPADSDDTAAIQPGSSGHHESA